MLTARKHSSAARTRNTRRKAELSMSKKYESEKATITEQPQGFALYSKYDGKFVKWSLSNLVRLLGPQEGKQMFLDAGGEINPRAR